MLGFGKPASIAAGVLFGGAAIKGFYDQVAPKTIDNAMDIAFGDPQADRAVLGTDLTPSMVVAGVGGIPAIDPVVKRGTGAVTGGGVGAALGGGLGAKMGGGKGAKVGAGIGGAIGGLIGGMFGGLGGIFLSLFVQKNMFVYYRSIGQIETAYYIMFIICGSAYLIAWSIMHFLVPKMERVNV
jgi:hypothetical protein